MRAAVKAFEEGRFVEARGFEIVEGGRVARPAEIDTDEAEENNTPVEMSLTWTTGDAVTGAWR